MIVRSYCDRCKKMRRFVIKSWDTKGCGPALVPVDYGSPTMLYTPETAEGWKVDGRCLMRGHVKRMVLPKAVVLAVRRDGALL